MTAFLLSALMRMAALFADHDATDAMIQRAGCPSNTYLAAMIDLHAKTQREKATLAVLNRTEGGCTTQAVGDYDKKGRPTSFGFAQRNGRPWEYAWLLGDIEAQVRIALSDYRASVRACGRGDNELAMYARGRCSSERGRELSRIRVRWATWVMGGGK